jgi:maltose phosphorylase
MYLRTSRLDLDDYNAEAYQGLHITSMAGTWMSVVEGFGGFRVLEGVPTFQTSLPEGWSSFAFKLQFRGRTLEVSVNSGRADVALLSGDPLEVVVNGQRLELG